MATLKDIAQATGVSIRTVSRVLKNDGYVRADVRKRVMSAASRLNYVPNRMARSLRMQRSDEICVLTWSADELQMAKAVALEQRLRGQGYLVNLLMVSGDAVCSGAPDAVGEAVRRGPAGVVTVPGLGDADRVAVARFAEAGIPCVSIDPQHALCDHVRLDRPEGVYRAVHYAASRRAGSIVYVGVASEINDWARLEGYRRAMSELGLEARELYPSGEAGQFAAGVAAAHGLARSEGMTVIAFSDVVAMGLLHGLHQGGLSVPQDVAVIGFDDRACAACASPPLTTIAQPNQAAGIAAAELLLERLANPDLPLQSRLVQPTLIIRESA